MQCYMSREHRKAESGKIKRQDLDYNKDRSGVGFFCDLEERKMAWCDDDVRVSSIGGFASKFEHGT